MIKIRFSKKWLIILSVSALVLIMLIYPGYLLAEYAFNRYFEHWGNKLVELEKQGRLSKQFGAGWQDVLVDRAMSMEASRIMNAEGDSVVAEDDDTVQVIDGIVLADYPSLSIIDQLRQVKEYSNVIEIVDRKGRPLSRIKTDHSRATIDEFPPTLVTALLAAEDGEFKNNNLGFEFKSFARAASTSMLKTVFTFKKSSPKGTSTITQQVAKLFISRLNEFGMRQVSHSVDRKVRELRIAVALRKLYSADDILEVYMNHCVTSDYGMIGFKDMAKGLFNKELDELTDAECVYLARMVKWGRNIKSKIVRQCNVDMPRMASALGWDENRQREVLEEIAMLQFEKPRVFQGEYGPLVDLANEFWLLTLKKKGFTPKQLEQMNIIDPNSLIRKKGNLRIQLTIDLPLQQMLQGLVDARGYGQDTTIIDEVRIGSSGKTVVSEKTMVDTIRAVRVLKKPIDYSEPGNAYITSLNPGDTVIVNIRYKKTGKNEFRRSCFYYVKRPVIVNGQYFSYGIMDSKTGELLAYYSKDRLGSRLACLLRNSVPNGSSTAKPILNALNYDLGIFKPYSKWTDTVDVYDVPWAREIVYKNNKKVSVMFKNSAVRGRGYPVQNHNQVFDGCHYVFEHL
ncbi:MAG: transglycosylase domain-containing protein, partial [Fibrobacter sp.]|nr:transglycosylase domain-containing protein [Fibrobacter sp.]